MLQLIGYIRAGFASPAEEELSDTLDIENHLIRDKDSSYLLRVQGDSMNDAGIIDGDYVVFERTHDCRIGDIVVALTEDGYTLKYLQKDRQGRFYLQPANDQYPAMYPQEGQIIGVVVSTFRTYKS